ncbi:MAG TPA: DUF6379 domain-containing protein [Microbacterium sp.]|uniref:C-glycoside deglycosidase beta subunit domain-containing protein n=1 Tax=Microbacterium sp. TaxID=51671 RepID=UPI002C8CD72B|nr:DUF6379 domain-containing protein [Microbacterium sp.]HWI30742.1 DUF6379 domain-containing protein [Microbacterium sp.]
MARVLMLEGALGSAPEGYLLRISLPWIRSMPLSCVTGLRVQIDAEPEERLTIDIDGRTVTPSDLARSDKWWFLQDHLQLRGHRRLRPGAHTVTASFQLVVPYLNGHDGGPLTVPFRDDRTLELDCPAPVPSASLPVA